MAQRLDEREPTLTDLDVYNKLLKLSDHTISVCKPKDKNVNNKHIPKRFTNIGNMLIEYVVTIGADIIEANELFVGENLNREARIANYRRRVWLQEDAKSLTFRMEHLIRTLHTHSPFADSTITYWMALLTETRSLLTKWRDRDLRNLNRLM